MIELSDQYSQSRAAQAARIRDGGNALCEHGERDQARGRLHELSTQRASTLGASPKSFVTLA